MSDPHGWPDPDRSGVPANPELQGAHVLVDALGGAVQMLWRSPWWITGTSWSKKPAEVAGEYRYVGPCLTPAEVAAKVAEEREACALVADDDDTGDGRRIAAAIRARGGSDE